MRISFLIIYLITTAGIVNTIKGQASNAIAPYDGNGMGFTPNKGQIVDMQQHLRPEIIYKCDGGGTDIYLRKTGIMGKYYFDVLDPIQPSPICNEKNQYLSFLCYL